MRFPPGRGMCRVCSYRCAPFCMLEQRESRTYPARMTNPITDAEVDAIDANLEPERRIQSLIHLWLKFYFSGSPVQTKGSTGASVSYTFVPCEFTYNTDALPRQTNASKPVIHIFTAFRDTKRADYTEDAVGHDDDWTILLMPKVRTG